ncbi:MAG: hypothetical protein U0166_16960 [Acidobacteriota bacterium]
MIDPSRYQVQVRERAAAISLGKGNRAVVDIPGHTPIRLERWELEAFADNDRDGDLFRKAVVLRALCRDLSVALERRNDLPPPDRAALGRQIPKVLQQSQDVIGKLAEEGKIDDDFISRKYLLTRDHLQEEIEPLTAAFGEAGGDPTTPATSGAYARQVIEKLPENLRATSLKAKIGAAVVFVAVLGLFLALALRPRTETAQEIDVAAYEGVVSLDKMWKSGEAVGAIVTREWYAMPEADRAAAAKDLWERVRSEQGAKRLLLYQPDRVSLAAQLSDGEQRFFPKAR